MNQEFEASPRQARSILAITAVLATLLVLGSIEGLSQYYGAEAQLASAQQVTTIAQR